VNVTAAGATRRRLQASPSAAPTSSSGILAAYLVVVASHYDQSALQSQLTSATSNGFFNQQLTVFAEQFGAAGFVNATSAALVIATASPTASPFVPSPQSSSKLSGGAIAGLTIMSFVVVCAIGFAVYYYLFMAGSASFKTPDWTKRVPSISSMPSIPRLSNYWQRRSNFDPFQGERESAGSHLDRRSVVEFVNPSYVARTNIKENKREEKDQIDFVNPSFASQPRVKKPKKEDIDIFL
jgi:hypothetical protein